MTVTKEEEDKLKSEWELEYNQKRLLQSPQTLPTNKTPYIVLLVVMATIVLASIVLLEIFTDTDNAVTIGLIFGFGATLTTGILTYQRAERAETQSMQTHIMVNSRLSEWMKEAKAASHAEGEVIGRDLANARTDKLAGQNNIQVDPEFKE